MSKLRKRIFSLLSAMALTATLMPSASLFASAAADGEPEAASVVLWSGSTEIGDWSGGFSIQDIAEKLDEITPQKLVIEGNVNSDNSQFQLSSNIDWNDNGIWLGAAVNISSFPYEVNLTDDMINALYSNNQLNINGKFITVNKVEVFGIKEDIVKHTISASVAEECAEMGTVTETKEYREGASATVKATPANGYKFVKWVDEAGNEYTKSSVTLTVSEDKSFIAYFAKREAGETEKTDTIRIEAESATEFNSNEHKINTGSTWYGEASANDYLDYTGNCEAYLPIVITDTSVTYNISIRYSAEYDDRNPWVNIWQPGEGSETVTIGGETYFKASYHQLRITGPNRQFATQTIENLTFDAPGTYYIGLAGSTYLAYDYAEVTASEPVFETYTVVGMPSSEEQGTVTGGGNVLVGSDVTLTATTKSGYKFINWTLNGEEVGRSRTLVIENVSENQTYVANYKAIKYAVFEAEDFMNLQSEKKDENGDRFKKVDDNTAKQKKFNDVKFSGGYAVEMYKESSAIAIPFTIEEGNEEIEVLVGYDWGVMDESHIGGNQDSGMWINLYVPKSGTDENGNPYITEERKQRWAAAGWRVDGGSLAAGSEFSDEYFVLYNRLDPNKTVEPITIPANAVPGTYFISVATDAANCIEGTKDENGNVVSVQNPEAHGYYDYIKFPIEEDDGVVVGCNFNYTDRFGNDLMTNAFSQLKVEGTTVYFHPKAPRFIEVQGYTLIGWEEYDANGKLVDTITGSSPEEISQKIEEKSYLSGNTITFKAIYEVPEKTYTMTVANGRVYVMKDENDTEYSHMLNRGDSYKLANYAQVKLVAPDTNSYGSFQYWTLNGMIYSYDSTIFFSAWCDADFEAVYAEKEVTVTPAAFISDKVQEFGFETTDVAFHKITFNCAFYIPENVEFVSAGIIFTPSKANIEDLSGVTVSGTSLANMPAMTAVSTARRDQLYAEANNQVLMSLTGMKNGVSRYARSFLIYKENGEYKVAFSEGIAGITTSQAQN